MHKLAADNPRRHRSADPLAGVTRDATSLIYTPESAAEWAIVMAAAGLSIGPSHYYSCQEASGNLADAIGGKNLASTGSPLYRQAIAGWSRFAVGPNGTAANQFFNNATMANLNASSALVYAIVKYNQSAVGRQQVFHGSASNNAFEGAAGNAKMRLRTVANAANSTLDHTGQVRPFLLGYDRASSINDLISDIERVTITYGATSGAELRLTIGIASDGAASTQVLQVATWEGAGAEITPAQKKTLLQTLRWSVTW